MLPLCLTTAPVFQNPNVQTCSIATGAKTNSRINCLPPERSSKSQKTTRSGTEEGKAISIHGNAVERGTAFEHMVLDVLKQMSFQIARVGGPGDKGIDFRGIWQLSALQQVPVIGQCKYAKQRVNSKYFRELEGSLSREAKSTLGVFVSHSGYTPACIKYALMAPFPMLIAVVSDGVMKSALLNASGRALLPNLVIGERLTPSCMESRKKGSTTKEHSSSSSSKSTALSSSPTPASVYFYLSSCSESNDDQSHLTPLQIPL